MPFSRRQFLALTPATPLFMTEAAQGQPGPGMAIDAFPAHDPKVVFEMVSVSHGNVSRVRELLSNRAGAGQRGLGLGLRRLETPLGAAAHVGNREIAASSSGAARGRRSSRPRCSGNSTL
jgi:hypothetical protein